MSSVHPVPAEWAASAKIDASRYSAMYDEAASDPDTFWRREAQRIDWIAPFTKVKNTSFNEADFGIKWFEDGALNVSANCIDRHLAERGDRDVDDARVDGAHLLVADPQARHHARAEGLDDHVGRGRQLHEGGHALRARGYTIPATARAVNWNTKAMCWPDWIGQGCAWRHWPRAGLLICKHRSLSIFITRISDLSSRISDEEVDFVSELLECLEFQYRYHMPDMDDSS